MQGANPYSDSYGCRATRIELSTGELVAGPLVTTQMARAKVWFNKAGSKWRTMLELMLRYRAPALLIRSVAPEIAMGFYTREEIDDIDSSQRFTGFAQNQTDYGLDPMQLAQPQT